VWSWLFSYCSITDVVMHTSWIVVESDIWADFNTLARPGLKTETRGLTSVRHRTDKGKQLKYWMSGWLIFSFSLWTDSLLRSLSIVNQSSNSPFCEIYYKTTYFKGNYF
jgi:hypothetical protein